MTDLAIRNMNHAYMYPNSHHEIWYIYDASRIDLKYGVLSEILGVCTVNVFLVKAHILKVSQVFHMYI